MSDNDETKPRYKATRDLELVGDARLVPGGIEINGTIVDPNGHRVNVRGKLFAEPRVRAWTTKEGVDVHEVINSVTTPREAWGSSPLIGVMQAANVAKAIPLCICPDEHPWPGHLKNCPRRPPREEPRREWFADEKAGDPIADVYDRADEYRAWQREQAELPPEQRRPWTPRKR